MSFLAIRAHSQQKEPKEKLPALALAL